MLEPCVPPSTAGNRKHRETSIASILVNAQLELREISRHFARAKNKQLFSGREILRLGDANFPDFKQLNFDSQDCVRWDFARAFCTVS